MTNVSGMKITIKIATRTVENSEKIFVVGDEVMYAGHVPGGLIRVADTDGSIWTIDPRCTKEL